jgi:tetratricopeptide (TPR) repeat protein
MAILPVIGLDSNATPQFSPRQAPPTPIAASQRGLFEETVPAVPHFIGREAELTTYGTRLERDRFVVITGLAGMGKTTLGAKLARAVAADPDRIFWFTFDHVEKTTADALYWAVATFLENRGEASLAHYLRGEIGAQKPLERTARLNLLISALAGGDYVLCFDDFQIAADAPEVAYIFEQIRQRFVELRQRLPARFIIMGRAVSPDMEHLVPETLHGLTLATTHNFLLDRGVTLPREHLTQLWQQTEGNPKLLELSAGALRDLSGAAAGNFINSLLRRGDIRDYLLHNIYAALTPAEQVVMGALAVFPGPIDRSGVEELLSDADLGPIAQQIDALANKHVLELTPDDQIDCHDLVREYCYHILSRRDRDRFHARAERYFEQEQNWIAAAHHQLERREAGRALDLLVAHADDIINSGGAATLAQQLSRPTAAALTPAQRVLLRKTQGRAFTVQGHYQSALAAYEAALEEAAPEHDRAEMLWLIARTYLKLGDYEQTRDYCLRSLQISERAAGQQIDIARAHHDLGWAQYRLGRLPEAARHFALAEKIAQDSHERQVAAQASMASGVIAWKENRLEEARDRIEASRRVFREQGSRSDEANAIGNLGLVFRALTNVDRELACYLQAADVYEQIGDLHGLLYAVNNAGYLYLSIRNFKEAERYYTRLRQLAADAGQKPMLSLAFCGLADSCLAQSETRRALDFAVQARQQAAEAGTGLELGLTGRVLGDIWLALDDAAQAKRYFEDSIPILKQHQEVEELTKARKGYQTALTQLGFKSTQ